MCVYTAIIYWLYTIRIKNKIHVFYIYTYINFKKYIYKDVGEIFLKSHSMHNKCNFCKVEFDLHIKNS